LKLSARRLGRRRAADRTSGSGCSGDGGDNSNWDSNWGGSLKKSVFSVGSDGEEGDDKREGLHYELNGCDRDCGEMIL
jgi:hypothetical protein